MHRETVEPPLSDAWHRFSRAQRADVCTPGQGNLGETVKNDFPCQRVCEMGRGESRVPTAPQQYVQRRKIDRDTDTHWGGDLEALVI